MARPIAPTPTLSGKDAVKFIADIQKPQPYIQPTFNIKKMAAAVASQAQKHDQKQS